MIGFVYSDGGRRAAGYRGKARDCVARSIAIAARMPYREVYEALNELAQRERPRGSAERSSAGHGVHTVTYRRYLEALGWTWHATMGIGTRCRVHLRADELPAGRLVVSVSRHLTAVINGVIYDTHDCSRAGRRCVYGYFQK